MELVGLLLAALSLLGLVFILVDVFSKKDQIFCKHDYDEPILKWSDQRYYQECTKCGIKRDC